MPKAPVVNKQSVIDRQEAVVLSNGVTLATRKIPPGVWMAFYDELNASAPKPPTVIIEATGTEEENRDDPDYLEALQRHNVKRAALISDILLLKGTSLVKVPKEIQDVQSNWDEELIALGKDIPRSGPKRYLIWLKTVAISDNADMEKVLAAVSRKVGVSEDKVAQAERFSERN
jgi:hypothetical protein